MEEAEGVLLDRQVSRGHEGRGACEQSTSGQRPSASSRACCGRGCPSCAGGACACRCSSSPCGALCRPGCGRPGAERSVGPAASHRCSLGHLCAAEGYLGCGPCDLCATVEHRCPFDPLGEVAPPEGAHQVDGLVGRLRHPPSEPPGPVGDLGPVVGHPGGAVDDARQPPVGELLERVDGVGERGVEAREDAPHLLPDQIEAVADRVAQAVQAHLDRTPFAQSFDQVLGDAPQALLEDAKGGRQGQSSDRHGQVFGGSPETLERLACSVAGCEEGRVVEGLLQSFDALLRRQLVKGFGALDSERWDRLQCLKERQIRASRALEHAHHIAAGLLELDFQRRRRCHGALRDFTKVCHGFSGTQQRRTNLRGDVDEVAHAAGALHCVGLELLKQIVGLALDAGERALGRRSDDGRELDALRLKLRQVLAHGAHGHGAAGDGGSCDGSTDRHHAPHGLGRHAAEAHQAAADAPGAAGDLVEGRLQRAGAVGGAPHVVLEAGPAGDLQRRGNVVLDAVCHLPSPSFSLGLLALALGATVEGLSVPIQRHPGGVPVDLPGHPRLDEPGRLVVEPLDPGLGR